jgi:hypothetical protein
MALFNSHLNTLTDNISLLSTMSSAFMVIRKLGKLVQHNSLAGITLLFKDKKDQDDVNENSRKEDKKKKGEKGEAAQASISHVMAVLDHTSSSSK